MHSCFDFPYVSIALIHFFLAFNPDGFFSWFIRLGFIVAGFVVVFSVFSNSFSKIPGILALCV